MIHCGGVGHRCVRQHEYLAERYAADIISAAKPLGRLGTGALRSRDNRDIYGEQEQLQRTLFLAPDETLPFGTIGVHCVRSAV